MTSKVSHNQYGRPHPSDNFVIRSIAQLQQLTFTVKQKREDV